MRITLLAFAKAAEDFGWRVKEVEALPSDSPRQLFARAHYGFEPGTARAAVDCDYRAWDEPIGDGVSEVAIIPPVSGG